MTRFALAACALIAGCALFQPPPPKEAPLGPGEIRSAQAASNALTVGKSTKADVRAALGDATVVDFHTGYEVWAYRERPVKTGKDKKPPPPPRELVLLFDPSGTLAKTRVR